MNDREQPATPQSVWKSMNDKEDADPNIATSPDQLCAMARSREWESAWSRRILLALLTGPAGAFAYNAYSVSEPWIRLSQAWLLLWSCALLWRLRHPPTPKAASESCASYLRREFGAKRRALLDIRRFLFLLVPAILASWWAGGPAIRLRALGVDPSSRLYAVVDGPWPFLIIGLLLALVWLAFGLAARQATRELDDLRRRTQET